MAASRSPPIRCLAIDMDGTLLTSSGGNFTSTPASSLFVFWAFSQAQTVPLAAVTARTGHVLQRARAAGILPIICTGKIPGPWEQSVLDLELDAPMVFLQGALVRGSDGATLLERRLTPEACSAALGITDALELAHGREKICCLACVGGAYLAAGPSPMAREVPEGQAFGSGPSPTKEPVGLLAQQVHRQSTRLCCDRPVVTSNLSEKGLGM